MLRLVLKISDAKHGAQLLEALTGAQRIANSRLTGVLVLCP